MVFVYLIFMSNVYIIHEHFSHEPLGLCPSPGPIKMSQPECLLEERQAQCDNWGPDGECQHHSTRDPTSPVFWGVPDLEGSLPLNWNPTPLFCSSRNSPREAKSFAHGHGTCSWRSWAGRHTHRRVHVCRRARSRSRTRVQAS